MRYNTKTLGDSEDSDKAMGRTSRSTANSDTLTSKLLSSCNCSSVVIIVKGTSLREPGLYVQYKNYCKFTPTITVYKFGWNDIFTSS